MIAPLRRHNLIFKRQPSAPVFIDGRPVSVSRIDIPARCSVQVPTGDLLKLFPEGRKVSNFRICFTSTKIQTADESQGLVADEVEWQGVKYTVSEVQPWGNAILPHYLVALVNT